MRFSTLISWALGALLLVTPACAVSQATVERDREALASADNVSLFLNELVRHISVHEGFKLEVGQDWIGVDVDGRPAKEERFIEEFVEVYILKLTSSRPEHQQKQAWAIIRRKDVEGDPKGVALEAANVLISLLMNQGRPRS